MNNQNLNQPTNQTQPDQKESKTMKSTFPLYKMHRSDRSDQPPAVHYEIFSTRKVGEDQNGRYHDNRSYNVGKNGKLIATLKASFYYIDAHGVDIDLSPAMWNDLTLTPEDLRVIEQVKRDILKEYEADPYRVDTYPKEQF